MINQLNMLMILMISIEFLVLSLNFSQITQNSNTILLYDNGEIVVNNSKFKINELSSTDNIIFENTLLDSLDKEALVSLNVEGKAYHEWAMKIMEFLQKNQFIDVQIKTLK